MIHEFDFEQIGTVRSCFKEHFGIPRQSGLAPDAKAIIQLAPRPEFKDAVRGLESFSHLWIVFFFHSRAQHEWKPLVQPPRLPLQQKVGIFATREPQRLNPIGISAVKLDRIDMSAPGGIEIHISGVDMIDGTPVLDIKPYLSYSDSIPQSKKGWTEADYSTGLEIEFNKETSIFCYRQEMQNHIRLKELIEQALQFDPRPAPSGPSNEPIGPQKLRVWDFEVEWQVNGNRAEVTQINQIPKD